MFGLSLVVNIFSCSFFSFCNMFIKFIRLVRLLDYMSFEGVGEYYCWSGIYDENEEILNKYMVDMCKDLIFYFLMLRVVFYFFGIVK